VVGRILEGRALGTLAQQAQVEVAEASTHEQTDTTRRWKFGLAVPGHTDLIHTKIEFSHRDGSSEDVVVEVAPDSVVVLLSSRSRSNTSRALVSLRRAKAAIFCSIAAVSP